MHIVPLFAHNPSPWTGAGNHTYLIVSRGDALLIDAGVGEPRHLTGLRSALRDHPGASGAATLGRVLVTHGHVDHASGAPAIADACPGASFRKYPWPQLDDRHAVPWEPLADGAVEILGPHRLVAIHTPGHSPDHLCFFEPQEGVLFGGDLVLNGSSVVILASMGGSLTDYLASLRRVIELAPRRILPGHGEPIEDPVPLLRAYIGHRLMREQQIVDELVVGPLSVTDLVSRLYRELEAGLLNAAAESTLAHLHKLRDEGRAVAHAAADGTERWSLA
jgi:glyoxylase-like metal-dependent hydrolase (beta-lactamase superfamily II)